MCHCQPSHGSSIFCGPSLDANGNDIGSNEEKVLNLIREIPEIPENRIQCGPLSLSPLPFFLRSPHSLIEEEDSLVLALSLPFQPRASSVGRYRSRVGSSRPRDIGCKPSPVRQVEQFGTLGICLKRKIKQYQDRI